MTFARQVRFSRRVGFAVVGAGTLTPAAAASAGPNWAVRLAGSAESFLVVGPALAIFGAVFRPIHRLTWFNVVEPAVTCSDWQMRRAAWGPMRLWLRLDRDLRDADLRQRETE